jgi:hypothetical protein
VQLDAVVRRSRGAGSNQSRRTKLGVLGIEGAKGKGYGKGIADA